MALIMAGITETVFAGNTLTLTPESNQSFRVNKIMVTGASNTPAWLTVTIDNTQVGYFRVDAGKWNMLSADIPGKYCSNVLKEMAEKKYFKGYPVSTGQTFTLALSSGTADIIAEYDWFAPGDVKSTEQDGSQATDRLTFLFGNNSAAIVEATYGAIDNPVNPAGTFKFPFSAGFPAAYTGQAVALFAQPVDANLYTGNIDTYVNTQYLKMILNQEVLFDLSKNGFPFKGTGAAAGSANTVYGAGTSVIQWPRDDEPSKLWYFDPVIPFSAGDELEILASTYSATNGAQLPANDVYVGIALLTKKVK